MKIDGEIEDMVGRIELHEQVEHLVHDRVASGRGLVDLVYHHDDAQVQGERLLEDEIGLRHGAFGGVDEQEHAVRHLQHPLDLPAEIGVARRVDDVDQISLIEKGTVFRGDGDAPFPLQVHRIHETLFDDLVLTEKAALLE